MMRKWLFAAVMLLPGAAAALGLGKLDLNSALNEPFDARIQILSASVEELDSMKAGLASPEAFDRAGIPYGFGLSQLKFEIRETEEGPDYIRVYSTDAIREPFLNFLLEVNWSQGRLFREYTVLLDPPTYDPNRKRTELAPAPVQAAPGYGEVRPIEDNQVTYDLEYTPSAAPRVSPAISYSGGDYGPTATGDTLWSIASAMRPDSSVSVQQMMIALLRANPEAFIGNNINGLKRGQILAMPDEAAINSVSKTQAIELAKSQNNAWNDIRSGLADAVTDRPESPGVSATGADTAVIDEGMPEGDAELRLVAPDTSGEGIDEAVTEPGMDEETEQLLALANETIAALELENAELNDKLVESESIIEDLKRLIELKEDELAALQDQIASAAAMEEEAAAEEEMPAEEVAEEAAPAEAEEMEEPEAMTEEPVAEDEMAATEPAPADAGIMGMVNQYLGPVIEIVKSNMLVIGGAVGGIIVLLLGFAGFRKWQSSRAETLDLPEADFPDFDDVTEAADDADTGSMIDVADSEAATEVGDEDEDQEDKTPTPQVEEATDDATQIVTPEAEAPAEPVAEEEDEDPLAEVNVFMAFDQFDQAIDFVKNAIEGDPDNLDFHTRLLEVYYAAGDRKGYEEHARVLHEKVNGQGA
ncbi:MAG: FimV/HubP family polar landmark protein, partial [Gammaproteobacteria bacterium]|nr:FimV/HubP family polar landmark protein [Gammaproteobacteria bacterium]